MAGHGAKEHVSRRSAWAGAKEQCNSADTGSGMRDSTHCFSRARNFANKITN